MYLNHSKMRVQITRWLATEALKTALKELDFNVNFVRSGTVRKQAILNDINEFFDESRTELLKPVTKNINKSYRIAKVELFQAVLRIVLNVQIFQWLTNQMTNPKTIQKMPDSIQLFLSCIIQQLTLGLPLKLLYNLIYPMYNIQRFV